MGVSDKAMEYVLGKSLPKPPCRRSRSPFRNRKVIVHVETSESEYDAETSSDDSSFTSKKVRFKDDTKGGSDSSEKSQGTKSDEKKKSSLKKDSKGKQSDTSNAETSSAEDSDCACCKGRAKKVHKSDSSMDNNSQSKESTQLKRSERKGKQENQSQNSSTNQPQSNGSRHQNQSSNTSKPSSTQLHPNQTRPGQTYQYRSRSASIANLARNMVGRIVQPSRADVVLREDVVECPSDPRPNAFFDSKTGVLRVYHGPVYGNPYATIAPSAMNQMPLGTFSSHPGQFGDPSPQMMGFPPPNFYHSSPQVRNSLQGPVQKHASPNQQGTMPGTWPNNETGSGWNNQANAGTPAQGSPPKPADSWGNGAVNQNSNETSNNNWGGDNQNSNDNSNNITVGNDNQQPNDNSGSGWGNTNNSNNGGNWNTDENNNNAGGSGWGNVESSNNDGNPSTPVPAWQTPQQSNTGGNDNVGNSGWNNNQTNNNTGGGSWGNNQSNTYGGNNSPKNNQQANGGWTNNDSWGQNTTPAAWGNMSAAQSTQNTTNNSSGGGGGDSWNNAGGSGDNSGNGWNANSNNNSGSGGWDSGAGSGGNSSKTNGW